jgi:chaperone LolA
MKDRNKAAILIVVWLVLLLSSTGSQADVKRGREIIEKVNDKYKKMDSLKAEFEQTYTWDLAGETQTVSGTLYLTESNKYRIETNEQLVVTDGETVWSYSNSDKHVIIDLLKNSQGSQLPKEILLQYSKEFEPDFIKEEKIEGRKTYLLDLKPKEDQGLIISMKVWIDASSWITRKIEQIDLNDNRNTYIVRNIVENPELEPGLFRFEMPSDAEIVDLRGDNN